jgi:hypothetical protein
MGVVENLSDSSQLMGYNVYRTDETGTGAFTKIAGPVTVTTYADTYPPTLESGTFRYFVTDVFNDSETGLWLCESSSDTITVEFPAVGINEVTSGEISIYPNPATEIVNIVSSYNIRTVDVLNFIGQKVYSTTVDSKRTKLHVSGYQTGVYFIKVTTDQGTRTTKITVTR